MQREYKIKGNTSIYDVALDTLGGFDNIITLITGNTGITMNTDLNTLAGKSINYDDDYKQAVAVGIQLGEQSINNVGRLKGFQNMNIYDAALMAYGGFDNIIEFIRANGINSLNQQDITGLDITFAKNGNYNGALTKAISDKGYILSSYKFAVYADGRVTTWLEDRVTTDLEIRMIS